MDREAWRALPFPPHTHDSQNPNNQQHILTSYIPDGPFSCCKLLSRVACLHLNSLQASWICSPLLFNSSGHQTPPDSKSPTSFRGLTSFALNRFVLLRVSTIFPPLILAVHYPSSVLPFSLCFLPEYQGFLKLLIWAPKMLSSLWAILSILMDLATCSVKNTQAPCSSQFSLSKSRLLLLMNYRTLPANFKIIELQVVGEGLEIS